MFYCDVQCSSLLVQKIRWSCMCSMLCSAKHATVPYYYGTLMSFQTCMGFYIFYDILRSIYISFEIFLSIQWMSTVWLSTFFKISFTENRKLCRFETRGYVDIFRWTIHFKVWHKLIKLFSRSILHLNVCCFRFPVIITGTLVVMVH